jgi:hypothetical protein
VQSTTWKDKITDASNLWMNATRSEEDGRFAEATIFYLRDAADCLGRGLGARAALSCACAAGCLEKNGNINAARNLYFETAKMYEERADAVFGTSIREALWLLQEAHDYYIIGGDAQKAIQIYVKCASIARKSSPFVTAETLYKVLRIRRGTEARAVSSAYAMPQTSDVNGAIEGFLRLREMQISIAPTSPPVWTSARRTNGRPSIEKSIAS